MLSQFDIRQPKKNLHQHTVGWCVNRDAEHNKLPSIPIFICGDVGEPAILLHAKNGNKSNDVPLSFLRFEL